MRLRRPFGPIQLLVGAVVVLGASALIVVGTVLRHTDAPRAPALLGGPHVSLAGTKFAGYRDQVVQVSSIRASWRVPALAAHSQLGVAATWIGAQGPGGDSTPFIQVGTEENMVPRGRYGVLSSEYVAFFSDTVRDFRPDPLFGISAGDAITASLRLRHEHWLVTITDATTGQHRILDTVQEGTGSFPFAEWTQEDVTDAQTNQAEPYPDIAPTKMTALAVNGADPTNQQLQSTWMSLPGGYLGPTALRHDAFSVIPVKLSRAGSEYLKIINPEDRALATFEDRLSGWSRSTSEAVVKRQTNTFLSALISSDTQLIARRWPTSVRGLIRTVTADDRVQISELRAAAARGASAEQSAFLRSDSANEDNDFSMIRRRLGIQVAR